MPCTYVLYSKSHGRIYIGSTKHYELSARLKEHNGGKTRSTKPYKPWMVAYSHKTKTYQEARKLEHILKSGQGRKWVKANITPSGTIPIIFIPKKSI